jgi:hypothetical protein
MPVRRVGLLASAALAASLAGCGAAQHEANWQRLRVGMPRGEVEQLLGRPSSTYVPPRDDRGPGTAPARGERWQYGDTLSSLATRAVFADEADERAWVVFFGADGTVSGFRPPAWDREHRSVDPPPISPPSAAADDRAPSAPRSPDR